MRLGLILLTACSTPAPAVDWSARDAWRACAPAIDGWPTHPAPPWSALHLCANEATLTPTQAATLARMHLALGCAAP